MLIQRFHKRVRIKHSHVFAHFLPFHVTRHQATRHDDCNHCPDDWKHQTELARVHLEALLVDCDDFLNQAQEEDGGGDVTCDNIAMRVRVRQDEQSVTKIARSQCMLR